MRPSPGDDSESIEVSLCHHDFLKGVSLVPHNFDMPEKPIHGKLVNLQLRSDLFNLAYNKVYACDADQRRDVL